MKLLVVKLHALGDMIIATPALRRLREGLPEARIDLLTTEWTAPAIKGNPCVDELISVEDRIFFKPGIESVALLFRLLSSLRTARYDAVVVLHRHPFIVKFAGMIGARRMFYFGSENSPETVRLDEGRHSAITAYELGNFAVKSLQGKNAEALDLEDLRYEWFVSDEEISGAQSWMHKHNLMQDAFIVLAPGGGVNPGVKEHVRRWSPSNYAGIANRIESDLRLPVVLIGGKTDRKVCADVQSYADAEVVDLSGGVSIRISAAIMAKARVVVTNDSSPLHIAAAVRTPVVGIFGPTGAALKLPPGPGSYAASLGLPCSPCYFGRFKGCIFDNIRCMEELTVERVMKVVSMASLAEDTMSRQIT